MSELAPELLEYLTEPDKKAFMYRKYPCVILRNKNTKTLCGYVAIKRGHRLFGDDGDNLRVHGGITWWEDFLPSHKPTKNWWWLGLDCAHYGDLIPAYTRISDDEKYRNIDYVTNELEQLVDQLIELNKKGLWRRVFGKIGFFFTVLWRAFWGTDE